MGFWLFELLAVFAIAAIVFLLVLVLFEPGLRYRINPRRIAIDSPEFLRLLGALCDAEVRACDPVEVLNDGSNFYAAELAAIAKATETIHLEAYIFARGRVAQDFINALCERARAGVRVKVVIDAVGSFFTPDSLFQPLRDLGGRVEWYQPLRWNTFKRWNNRTHRKLIVRSSLTAASHLQAAPTSAMTGSMPAREIPPGETPSFASEAISSAVCNPLSPRTGSNRQATFWPISTTSP
jgi:cardiolipin synthase